MKHLFFSLLGYGLGMIIAIPCGRAATPPPLGFLVPIGGGASIGDNDVLKPAHIEIHRRILSKLQQNIHAGANIGHDICLLEYHPEGPDTNLGMTLNRRLFLAAGATETSIKELFLETREKADSTSLVSLLKDCGLFYIPGGDQTAIKNLWSDTKLHMQMLKLLKLGGGVTGKSAGAALQGTLLYLPRANSATSTAAFLQKVELYGDEIATEFLADALVGLPRIYIETHTGDRERSGRALAMLAAWEAKQGNSEARAMALAIDADTAALIEYNTDNQAWTAEVMGARTVEFLIPDSKSISTVSKYLQPSYLNMPSSLLTAGSRVQISGIKTGQILQRSPGLLAPSNQAVPQKNSCLDHVPSLIAGSNEADGETASEVFFRVVDPKTGSLATINDVEYAYLEGDLVSRRKTGCAFWLTHAFDLDFGHPENRLNTQRYAIGSGQVDFSISLPTSMEASTRVSTGKGKNSSIQFRPTHTGSSSSVLVFDARQATELGTAKYVYQEFGAKGPVQTGTWEHVRLHLMLPNSRFNFEAATISQ